MLIGHLGTKFIEILKMQNISLTKMHMQILSAEWWPFRPDKDGLIYNPHSTLWLESMQHCFSQQTNIYIYIYIYIYITTVGYCFCSCKLAAIPFISAFFAWLYSILALASDRMEITNAEWQHNWSRKQQHFNTSSTAASHKITTWCKQGVLQDLSRVS